MEIDPARAAGAGEGESRRLKWGRRLSHTSRAPRRSALGRAHSPSGAR
jgi:hypothetical protein